MRTLKTFLYLYFVFGFLYLLSAAIQCDLLGFVSKPTFIISVFFYYIAQAKEKINIYYCTILILLFFSGILNLSEDEDFFEYVLYTNFSAYVVLLITLIGRLIALKPQKVKHDNILYFILMFVFLVCLLYISSFIVFDTSFLLHKFIYIYGLMLLLIGLFSTILYTSEFTRENMYLMLAVLSMIICDLFYGIYYYYYNFIFFRYTSILCYIVSFYFLVNYFLKEENQ